MKKIKLVAVVLGFAVSGIAFAARAPEYISPNNDGVQDTLVIPLKIKEKRYIKEWKLTIYNENGKIIRTIGNKRKDEEKLTFASFFKKLIKAKSGVDIPEKVVWNGRLGEEAAALGLVPGDVAPDGQYYYTFSATDDNDNTGVSNKYYVIVDCTAPVISLGDMSDDEKSFGEGSKNVVRIKQSGSEEVLWSGAIIYNADGKKVRTYRWENSSPDPVVTWDGTSDNGVMVDDGIYYYEIYATDKAGNTSEKAIVNNIIFSAEKPVIGIALRDAKYFSPNGDGVQDFMDLVITLPESPSSINSLSEWKISIVDSKNNSCREISGEGKSVAEYAFDGKGNDGKILKDGVYKAVLSAKYKNGYIPPAAVSPDFVLDVTAPVASVVLSDDIFNGDKNLKITQKQASAETVFEDGKKWKATIKNSDGNIVRGFDFGSSLPDSVQWNGSDTNGHYVADGTYYYELVGTDAAGNRTVVKSKDFVLDSSKTELLLSASSEYFSTGAIDFYPIVKAATGIESYNFVIEDGHGTKVYSVEDNGEVPATISWNGKSSDGNIVADGKYVAQISTVAKSGTKASSQKVNVTKDSVAPIIEISSPYTLFSPDGLSEKISPRQVLPVKIEKSSVEEEWNIEIKNAAGKIVRGIKQAGNKSASDFVWDGKDDNGNKVADGKYVLNIYAVDAAGNRGEDSIANIVVDTRETAAYVTVSDEYICPSVVKKDEVLSVRTVLNDGIKSWSFDILASDGSSVKNWNGGEDSKVPTSFVWNGKNDDGVSYEGQFYGKIAIDYQKGNTVESQSTPFVVTSTAPVLSVISSANPDEYEYFSPDNDGYEDELDMVLYAKTLVGVKSWSLVIKDSRNTESVFWKTNGKSMPADGSESNLYRAQVTWDGRGNDGEMVMSAEDYPYEYTVTDNLGMTSVYRGIIPVDVLLILDNGRLKMQVPSIVFRGDAADFKLTGETDDSGKVIAKSSLTKEQRDNDIKILNRVAQILNKFSGYKVTVVGHANPMNNYKGDEANNPEENQDGPWGRGLKALSLERAQYVRKWLVEEGKISASRLKAEGKGGLETIADKNDLQNRWKNRRVEFILEK